MYEYLKPIGEVTALAAFIGLSYKITVSYLAMAQESRAAVVRAADAAREAVQDLADKSQDRMLKVIETATQSMTTHMVEGTTALQKQADSFLGEIEVQRVERAAVCKRHNQQMDQVGQALGEIVVAMKDLNGKRHGGA